MASPIGHGLMGIALARRLGVTSRFGLFSAALAASLPDGDIIAGAVLHGDPWKIHRQGTHTFGFAVTAGALAGVAGLLGTGSLDGERDIVLDALTGALIVGSHLPLDRMPMPTLDVGPSLLGMTLGNWIADALIWGTVAWSIWPQQPAQHSGRPAGGAPNLDGPALTT